MTTRSTTTTTAEKATRSLPRRLAPWAAVLSAGALLLGLLPSAFAATGDTAAEAILIGGEGRFTGTVAPSKSRWYRFSYNGSNAEATITVYYEPSDSNRLDFQVYTGTPDTLRPEASTPSRSGNVLTQTFSDPNPRDVFVQVVNNHPDRSVSLVGTVSPGAVSSPTPNATATYATPTPAPSADNPQAAITVGADGQFQGAVGPRKAVWHRFFYGNPGADASVSVEFAPSATGADINLYTGADLNNLTLQGGSASRSGNTVSRTVNLSSPQFVYFTVVNNNDASALAYAGRVAPAFAPPTTPTATATPAAATATATPATQPTSTPQAAPAVPRDARYFTETGFRVDDDDIFNYFQARGRIETFGFPVSRSFTFLGCKVQIFQRQVAQKCTGNTVQLLNLLDPDIFPYTRVNQSVFPATDEGLKNATPRVSDPNYATAILEFVRANAPEEFEGRPVRFGTTFFSLITPAMAGTDNPGIIGLFNLEVWGAPISRPQRDPGNANFIYQRFQRGIMHYIEGQGTRGILLADYLKAIMLGERAGQYGANLPSDLREQAQSSRYFNQYCPGGTRWLCRPNDLPSTDLTFAFERG